MPFAAFRLEEGRSDRPTMPAHLEAAEPATGIRGLFHVHQPNDREEEVRGAGMNLVMAEPDLRVEQAELRTGSTTPRVASDLPCRTFDPDLWFAEAPAELELAKSLCGECPVRVECLAGAVERAEPWGVWGGEIFERGAVVPRKRPRGRPRKEDVARDAVLRVEAANRTAALVADSAA
jgi:WhiB family redox-sensing transcriptional regulator